MDAYGSLNPVLEITVLGCSKLKKNHFTKQHPYVWLDYVGMEFRTTSHKGGGNDPTYNQKYYFRLIENVDQMEVRVYSRNTVASDTFIGSGRVYLQRVLCMGYDETAWPIVDKRNKYAGEVRLSMAVLHGGPDLQQPQPAPSAPPLVNDNEHNAEESFENMAVTVLSNAIGNLTVDKLLENIGLFILTKTLEYLGLKSRSR